MEASQPLILYRADNSYSLVPHSLLLHYDIPFTSAPMTSTTGTMSTGIRYAAADGSPSHDDYLANNSSGFVPALVLGTGGEASTITDVPGVLVYISSLVPRRELLGESPVEQARVAEWMAWLPGTLHSAGFAAFMRQGRLLNDKAAFPAVSHKATETIKKGLMKIDTRLRERLFVIGDRLTAVDFNPYLFWRWAIKNRLELGPCPR